MFSHKCEHIFCEYIIYFSSPKKNNYCNSHTYENKRTFSYLGPRDVSLFMRNGITVKRKRL